MITLEELIKSEFEQVDSKEIVGFLSKEKLLHPIKKSIAIVNAHLGSLQHELDNYGVPQLAHVASILLIKINEQLRLLKANKKANAKKKLEYLLGNILRQLLIQITHKLPDEVKIKFSTTTYNALKETCILYDYDFEELMKFLNIQSKANENSAVYFSTATIDVAESVFEETPSYSWYNNSNKQFEAFLEMVKRNGITKDTGKLRKLFENPAENLAIKFDETRPSFVVQFLSCVSDSGYVIANGCKFYQVLECHVFNFKEVFLKNTSAQRRVAAVKRPKGWAGVKNRIEKELKEIYKLET